jgi:hypothetical protein
LVYSAPPEKTFSHKEHKGHKGHKGASARNLVPENNAADPHFHPLFITVYRRSSPAKKSFFTSDEY